MKSHIEQTTRVVLVLTDAEATWLRALVQNPVKEPEEPQDAHMRQRFFDALTKPENPFG